MILIIIFDNWIVVLFGLGGFGLVMVIVFKVGGVNVVCFDDNDSWVVEVFEVGFVM